MFRVPVIILGGFLGSGKTTLLSYLYEQAKKRNYQPGILINELGAQDTDGKIMQQGGANQLTLLEGCVCCTKKSEIVHSFEKLLHLQPDIIFVELTGVANPLEVSIELSKRELISKIYLNKMITVLDAKNILFDFERFAENKSLLRTLSEQLAFADAILINKTDLIQEKEQERIVDKIRQKNKSSQIFFTQYSQFNADFIFAELEKTTRKVEERGGAQQESTGQAEASMPTTSYASISTVSLPVLSPLSEEQLTTFFAQLGSKLVRAKGFVEKDDGQIYLIQFAGNRIIWEPFSDFGEEPYLTLIGVDFKARDLFQQFQQILSI